MRAVPLYQILIADDHPLFRDAFAGVVQQAFVGSTVLQAQDFSTCLQLAQDNPELDLIVLDLHMPGSEGLGGLQQLVASCSTIPVVMVSAEENRSLVLQSMAMGAVGFLIKTLPREQIIKALEQVLQGQVYLPAELLRATPVVEQASSQVSEAQLRQMTKRQLRVLQCLAQGLSNKQIADLLCIAETTVKTHVSDVLRKMQVRNRTQAALVVDAKVLDTVLGG